MNFEKEIERAVYHQIANDTQVLKGQEEINNTIESVKNKIKKREYDFSKLSSMVLNQSGKKRFVKLYSNTFSVENILCQYIKQLIDRTFKVNYPNRNSTITDLFNILTAVRQMSNFTIVKFDFKDYFNSVSATYVYEKILKNDLKNRIEVDIIEDFTSKTKYTYAGLSTSNVLAEMIAKQFDEEIKKIFLPKGLLFFKRYIDDSILILNQDIAESDIRKILKDILFDIYYDETVKTVTKCKTVFNDKKWLFTSMCG